MEDQKIKEHNLKWNKYLADIVEYCKNDPQYRMKEFKKYINFFCEHDWIDNDIRIDLNKNN
jgi:hypothetical protein